MDTVLYMYYLLMKMVVHVILNISECVGLSYKVVTEFLLEYFREITLRNGLTALLISDMGYNSEPPVVPKFHPRKDKKGKGLYFYLWMISV